MKKLFIFLLLFNLIFPLALQAEDAIGQPTDAAIIENDNSAFLSWKNPQEPLFTEVVLFRSTIPIPEYFTYEAVDGLCDEIYRGREEAFTDTGLAVNLPYYYILFAFDSMKNNSKAVLLEKIPLGQKTATNKNSASGAQNASQNKSNTLAGASSEYVNQVSLNEAGIVYNFNKALDLAQDGNARRLALFIIVKSPHDLKEQDKSAISYFIHAGTPTTIFLGTGERAGVLNSYLSVFDKLPRNTLEWQDVIKIANGRWPDERNLASENRASDVFFSAIYERKPDMKNPNDNAAVTVIAYGLRPANRNLASEKKAIEIYRRIFYKNPAEASDWDLVRAIAYSGATR